MPGFYYYLPDMTKDRVARGGKIDREVLEARGLADVLADIVSVPKHASASDVNSGRGPDGKNGCILSITGKHERLPAIGNSPGQQTWKPIGDGIKAWLGIWTESPPEPLSLERWTMTPGYVVTDPHGQEWTIPVARSQQAGFAHGTLPQSFTFDQAGEPQGVLQPSWAWLWELAGEIRNWYAKDVAPDEAATPVDLEAYEQPPFTWLVKAAARILQVNYRVGLAELNFLHELGREVLTQTTVHAIARSVIDHELVCEAKKKPTAETSSSAES